MTNNPILFNAALAGAFAGINTSRSLSSSSAGAYSTQNVNALAFATLLDGQIVVGTYTIGDGALMQAIVQEVVSGKGSAGLNLTSITAIIAAFNVVRAGLNPVAVVIGNPDAIAFFNALGVIDSDSLLTVLPIDQFGRPQLRDLRQNLGTGAIWRQGAWQADGDPQNIIGEGIVIYGPITAGTGGFGRIKADRFQLRRIVGGLDGSAFRVDTTEMFMQEDTAGARVMEVRRSDGRAFFGELHITSNTGPRILSGTNTPEGAVIGSIGDLFLRTNGGANTTLYVKESGAVTNTGWIAK